MRATEFRYQSAGDPDGRIAERSVMEIAAEALRLYAHHWRELLVMSAVVNAPIAAVQLLTGASWGYVALVIALTLLGSAAFYSAAVSAVCQHYLFGRVDVGTAYRRAQWRFVSVLAVSALSLVIAVAGIALIVLIVPFIAALVYTVYWSVAVPAVVVEGHRPVDALRRSYRLVRGSWWRIFGALVLFVAVAVALGLIGWGIQLLVIRATGDSGVATAVEWAVTMATQVGVPPLMAICFTLLYYDLRTRKEDLSLATLRRDLGLTRPGGPPGSTAATAA